MGFIFGSVKANPWWGNVLMPIIFIMSAMVSGIALCVFNYMVLSWIRRKTVDMKCLDVMGMFLFYALVVDAAIEGLDWIHRIYSAEEGFQVMQYMAREKLFYTLSLGQVACGTLVPLILLGLLQLVRRRVPELQRRRMYFTSASLILMGVLAMRWNVVIGGQLFSKSLRGVMGYKMEFAGLEGWFMGAVLLCLPFVILTVMVKLFLSERLPTSGHVPHREADLRRFARRKPDRLRSPRPVRMTATRESAKASERESGLGRFMTNGERTGTVLLVLAVVFFALGLKFVSGFGTRLPTPSKIPLVDPQFLDTATIRKSYAELIRTKADLSDFDCYACHEKGKPPPLRFDAQHNLIVPQGTRGHCDGARDAQPEQQLFQLPRRAEPGTAASPRRAAD